VPSVTWLGHATVLLEIDGVRLLTDPVLTDRIGPLVRIAPTPAASTVAKIDAVLLSHLHADHAERRSLRMLGADTPVIAPPGARRWLEAIGMHDVRELHPGERTQLGPLQVWTTEARHGGRWLRGAAPCGLVISGSRTIYFAGDTDLFAGMADLAGTIDLALLPIAGWGPTLGPGHMDPGRAATATALIAPRRAVPIHWGTLALAWPPRLRSDPSAPARLFAALAACSAPAVRVDVLTPGGRLDLDEHPVDLNPAEVSP
jgi:L-ascorbate metabolism protein UlaG (beta-lactamase superfamily)